ncbi:MAG: hypothetical protein QM688_05635 [Sphingomonas bacterium]
MAEGITSANAFLRDAVKSYLITTYDHPPIKLDEEIDPNLGWRPSLNSPINNHLMVIEASEKVYPLIFRMRRAEMAEVQSPIAVYCVCPEEAYLQNQKDAQDLEKHGFGLFTVNGEGQAIKKFAAIPIAQHITENDYAADVKRLPPKIRRMAKASFETYRGNSPAGVASLSEIVEGVILKAAKEAAKKGWMSTSEASSGLAAVVDKMKAKPQFNGANAALSSAQAFISRYRNASHHFPKNSKQAHLKYRDCRHGFLDGLRHIQALHDAMKAAGLTGSV